MPAFRDAYNKEMMDQVETYKYDKYFNNWINPKVLEKFTSKNAKKNKKMWEKSYGLKNCGQLKEYGRFHTAQNPSKKNWKKICYKAVSSLSI